jgi:hypothetical protein
VNTLSSRSMLVLSLGETSLTEMSG